MTLWTDGKTLRIVSNNPAIRTSIAKHLTVAGYKWKRRGVSTVVENPDMDLIANVLYNTGPSVIDVEVKLYEDRNVQKSW